MIKINQKEIEEQLQINLIQQIHVINFRSSFTKPTSGEPKLYFFHSSSEVFLYPVLEFGHAHCIFDLC